MIFPPMGQSQIFQRPDYGVLGPNDLGHEDVLGGMPLPAQAPAEPFQWGAGGVRLTPDQLALRQQDATSRQQADFSPIQSPWQGVGRVLNNVSGALEQRQIDKQSAAMQTDRARILSELSGGEPSMQGNAISAALMSGDPALQRYAMQVDERLHPKPVNNDTVQDYNFRAQTLGPDAANEWLKRGNDPFITATLPGGQFYAGPQSGFAAAMGGGGGAPAAVPGSIPMGSPLAAPVPYPGAVQDGYRFKGGDPSDQKSWEPVG